MNALNEILTVKEASELWGQKADSIKKNCIGQKGYPPRFTSEECRKSAGTWLVTRSAMLRLYGEPKINE